MPQWPPMALIQKNVGEAWWNTSQPHPGCLSTSTPHVSADCGWPDGACAPKTAAQKSIRANFVCAFSSWPWGPLSRSKCGTHGRSQLPNNRRERPEASPVGNKCCHCREGPRGACRLPARLPRLCEENPHHPAPAQLNFRPTSPSSYEIDIAAKAPAPCGALGMARVSRGAPPQYNLFVYQPRLLAAAGPWALTKLHRGV